VVKAVAGCKGEGKGKGKRKEHKKEEEKREKDVLDDKYLNEYI
jgi:hypothetical protein